MSDDADHKLRCGDHVKHRPSGEEWVVAYADYNRGRMSWVGWPEGTADISDCTLIRAATDEEHAAAVDEWRQSEGRSDHRRSMVLRMYGTPSERGEV